MKNELRGIVLATLLGLMGQEVWMPKPVTGQVNTYHNLQTFEGQAGEQWTIDFNSSESGVFLMLRDPEGNTLAQVRNVGEGNNVRVVVTLPITGTYTVVSNTYQPQESRHYTLSRREASLEYRELAEAEQLNTQAIQLYNQGKYNEAIPLAEQALAIRQRILGDHLGIAASLNNLAGLYQEMGRYSEAEPMYVRALSIYEQQLGDHPDTATSLSHLAGLYWEMGRYSEAEPLYVRALDFKETFYEKNHPILASSLNNLALLYRFMKRYSEAESLYLRALSIHTPVDSQDEILTGQLLNGLAQVYRELRRYKEAEPLYKQALAIYEQKLGKDHPHTAKSLNNLALLYESMGRYGEAEPLYLQALSIRKQKLGADHPHTAQTLNNLALLYWAQGSLSQSIDFLNQGLNAEEKNLTANLVTGSEQQKRDYLATVSDTKDWAISVHLNAAPNNPQAARLATTALLQRQGRILDVFTNSLQLLRQQTNNPEIGQLLDDYTATTRQRANLEYNTEQVSPEAYRNQLAALNEQVTQLEAKLSSRSSEFAIESQPATLETIQPLIPADAALVQLVRYRPYNPQDQSYGAPRYAAYILTASGEPQGIDLGEAAAIEETVESFDRVFRVQNAPPTPIEDVKEVARDLDKRLMEPVRSLLGDVRHLIIAPDGALNLIPFEALVDENDNYLVETYSFSYLTGGRDLLRLQTPSPSWDSPSSESALIVANPDFKNPGDVALRPPDGNIDNTRSIDTRFIDLSQLAINPLDGTKLEAEAIAELLGVAPLLGSSATEAAVMQANRPNFLHIATHGFFEPAPTTPEEQATDNPLLRSGLVLAGVKRQQSGGEGLDGVLTAMETASLNLVGTKLVVLSACETGVGDISAGEGIYGLRRALVLAGSQSQVISLWKVDDEATKDLMVAYYNRVLAGEGRGEALRRVQLEMLDGEEYNHPYYWAAFIPSGDWRGIEGKI